MATDITLVRGDTIPVRATLRDKKGVKNITGAAVAMVLTDSDGTRFEFSSTILTPATSGKVENTINWGANPLLVDGNYQCEYRVTYADTTVQTFPNKQLNIVRVRSSL